MKAVRTGRQDALHAATHQVARAVPTMNTGRSTSDHWRGAPNPSLAMARYALLARSYDYATRRLSTVRAHAVAALGVRDGDVVFDLGCGTGALLPELAHGAGRSGLVLGFELSPAMAALAARRTAEVANVEIVCGPVESMQPGSFADALVFFYTHDLLQNPDALARVFACTRPGARVVVAGLGLLGPWAAPLNLLSAWRARRYLTTFRGLRRPWQLLLQYCPDLRVLRRYFPGTNYLAFGHYRASPCTSPTAATRCSSG